jgi:hypothetical protein
MTPTVPGNNLDELRLELHNLIPTRLPEPIRVKDPVLVVGVGAVVGAEPG